MTESSPLTALQSLRGYQPDFCLNYVQNGNNGKRAAIAAGYSEKGARRQAWELLQRDDIQAAIAEVREQHRAVIESDIEDFMLAVLQDIEDAKDAGQHTAVPKSRELFGKVKGYVVDRREIRGQLDVSVIDNRSDAELLEAAAELFRVQGIDPTGFLAQHVAPSQNTPTPPLIEATEKSVPATTYKKNSPVSSPDA